MPHDPVVVVILSLGFAASAIAASHFELSASLNGGKNFPTHTGARDSSATPQTVISMCVCRASCACLDTAL